VNLFEFKYRKFFYYFGVLWSIIAKQYTAYNQAEVRWGLCGRASVGCT